MMKTQVSILVKGDFLMWYTNLPFWILSKKPYIGMYVDKGPDQGGELVKLKLSKKPYILEVEPGTHEFWFVDSNAGNKKLIAGAAKLGVGIALDAFGGFSSMAGPSSALDVAASQKVIQDNYMHIILNEGDDFKISLKPGRKGAVKIKELS